jgi:hypothetical protein
MGFLILLPAARTSIVWLRVVGSGKDEFRLLSNATQNRTAVGKSFNFWLNMGVCSRCHTASVIYEVPHTSSLAAMRIVQFIASVPRVGTSTWRFPLNWLVAARTGCGASDREYQGAT